MTAIETMPALAAAHRTAYAPPRRDRPRRRLTLLVLALLVAAAVVVSGLHPAPARAAAPPSGFMGVTAWDPVSDGEFSMLAGSRVRTYRMLLQWRFVEPRRGSYDWRYYDRVFLRAARRGIRIMPVLHGTPRWAAAEPRHRPTTTEGKRAFYEFVYRAAKRYGPQGSFWTTGPWSPANPAPSRVRPLYWQVWNEPNIAGNWQPRPNAAAYGKMLKAVSTRLKRGSSGIRVVAAGLPWPAQGVNADTYLWQLLEVPGVLEATDAFAVHPYGKLPINVTQLIDRARGVLNSRGAGSKGLWVTEFGWATGAYDGRWTVRRDQQAKYLDDVYRWMLANRRSRKLLGGVWFCLRDHRALPGQSDYWGYRSGLLEVDGDPKPSWTIFSRRARSGY